VAGENVALNLLRVERSDECHPDERSDEGPMSRPTDSDPSPRSG
jgi:hypothetical protein